MSNLHIALYNVSCVTALTKGFHPTNEVLSAQPTLPLNVGTVQHSTEFVAKVLLPFIHVTSHIYCSSSKFAINSQSSVNVVPHVFVQSIKLYLYFQSSAPVVAITSLFHTITVFPLIHTFDQISLITTHVFNLHQFQSFA